MNRFFKVVTVAAVAATSVATEAGAFPRTISYQGRATDALNNPITDPAAAFQFRLYDAAVGGTLVWSEATNLAVTDGLFSHNLGSSCPGCSVPDNVFFDDDSLWLEVQYAAEIQTPRTLLTASAYAYRVGSVDQATGGVITGEVSISSSSIGNTLEVGNSSAGRAALFQNSSTEASVQVNNASGGPAGSFFSDGGPGLVATSTIGDAAEFDGSVDINGSVRSLEFRNNSDQVRAELGLGADGGELVLRSVAGTAGVTMVGGIFGDNGVVLSSGAISSPEILNEAGVANNSEVTGTTILDAGNTTVAFRTLVAPADGYVIAMATGTLDWSHSTGVIEDCNMFLTDVLGGASGPSTSWQLSGNLPTGSYKTPYGVTGVFQVAAGNVTVYLRGNQNGNFDPSAEDNELTLLYVPTAYGAVEPASPPANPNDPMIQSVSDGDDAAQELNRLRLEQEVAMLREQVNRILEQMDGSGQE